MGLVIQSADNRSSLIITNGRLQSDSISTSKIASLVTKGDVFWSPTDFVALTTTASYTGIYYLKNTSNTKNIVIEDIVLSSTVNSQWLLRKSSTTGTLISAGTSIDAVNAFQSPTELSADILKGSDAQTVTDGLLLDNSTSPAYGFSPFNTNDALTLSPNESITLECKPAAAGDVGVTLVLFTEPIA